ncbi:major facilitator superfamily domain-containing protein [Naematelia encephala]|uniref:Major facilitator superfamily domain-containing protein n=1 Tax=Naematelia encephala TaxID=71784 RepID=A0A1Y2ATN1_9TREE|nr:major facilitator superfamily domain-containing protein [Naematelia encephala]
MSHLNLPDEQEKGEDAFVGVLETHVDVEQARKDATLNLLAHHKVTTFDPNSPEVKKVVRKIDLHIMTMVFSVYCLQLMDKNSLSYAAIEGIKKATHLTASQYSWLGSIVYFGYLGGDIPAVYFLQKFDLVRYFSIMTIAWGIVVACQAACSSFAGLAVCRFLLGFIEVCTVPACFHITASYYTAEEQIARVSFWYTSSALAGVFGGFFAWCLYFAGSFGWRAIFILYGGLTICCGLIMLFFLDASPSVARWLSEDEKVIALERLRSTRVGSEKWGFNKEQFKEAFTDIRIYLIFALLVSTGLPNGGLTAFGPTIIQGFGFKTSQTTLLAMVPGAFETLIIPIFVLIARKITRGAAGIIAIAIGIIGTILMLTVPAHAYGARYLGYVLTLQYPICIIFVITYITSGVSGTTKKFAFNCLYQAGFAAGNIIGPQTFRGKDAPNYAPAKYTMLAFIVVSGLLLGVLEAIHYYWNKKRDAQDAEDERNGVVHPIVENEEFMDLTDFQQRHFRYPL